MFSGFYPGVYCHQPGLWRADLQGLSLSLLPSCLEGSPCPDAAPEGRDNRRRSCADSQARAGSQEGSILWKGEMSPRSFPWLREAKAGATQMAKLRPVLLGQLDPCKYIFFSANSSTPSHSKINKRIFKTKPKLHKLNSLMSGFIFKLVLGPVNCTLPQKTHHEKE